MVGELLKRLLPGFRKRTHLPAPFRQLLVEIRELLLQRSVLDPCQFKAKLVLQMLSHQKGLSDPPSAVKSQKLRLPARKKTENFEAYEQTALNLPEDGIPPDPEHLQWHRSEIYFGNP